MRILLKNHQPYAQDKRRRGRRSTFSDSRMQNAECPQEISKGAEVIRLVLLSLFVLSLTRAFAQSDNLPLNNDLSADDIPPIPRSLAAEVAHYTKGRAAEMLSWHPLRREMLVVTVFGNTPQVHEVKSPGGARIQLTFFDDRVSHGVSYQPMRGDFFLRDSQVRQAVLTQSTVSRGPMNRRALDGRRPFPHTILSSASNK
jgi:hypothetical protein